MCVVQDFKLFVRVDSDELKADLDELLCCPTGATERKVSFNWKKKKGILNTYLKIDENNDGAFISALLASDHSVIHETAARSHSSTCQSQKQERARGHSFM